MKIQITLPDVYILSAADYYKSDVYNKEMHEMLGAQLKALIKPSRLAEATFFHKGASQPCYVVVLEEDQNASLLKEYGRAYNQENILHVDSSRDVYSVDCGGELVVPVGKLTTADKEHAPTTYIELGRYKYALV